MKIIIAGGQTKADFLIGLFKKEKHHLVVINDEEKFAEYLAKKHDIDVIVNDPTKYYVLEQANIDEFDVLVALLPNDPDNLAVCQLAKCAFHVKKTVAAVSDPKNIEIFQKLGVDTALSATYLISRYIERASTLEKMARSIVSEFDSLAITTVEISATSSIANKKLLEINLPAGITFGAIMRGETVIVPKGQTVVLANDKVLVISDAKLQQEAIDLLR